MLFVSVGGQETESGPGLQRKSSVRMRGRDDRFPTDREQVRGPPEDAPRLGDVFEYGEKKDDVERPLLGQGGRRDAAFEVPFEKIREREARPLQSKDVRIPITAHVRKEASWQVRQAASHVEDARTGGHVRQGGREARRPDAPGEPAVEGRTRRHARVLHPPP